MKRNIGFSIFSFFIFSMINLLCYLIINVVDDIGFKAVYFEYIFSLPFVYCLFLFLFSLFIEKSFLWFPLFSLTWKLCLIIPEYDFKHADILLGITTNFSLIFNIAQKALQHTVGHTATTEITLHTLGMFLYQVLILYFAKKVSDRTEE